LLLGRRAINLVSHDLRDPPTSIPGAFADVVIDFGTIDNVTDPAAGVATSSEYGLGAYREAARILRPGGLLLTTFADLRFWKTTASVVGDEIRRAPGELTVFLNDQGMAALPLYNNGAGILPAPAARVGMAFRKVA
jgi:hypothetical protein